MKTLGYIFGLLLILSSCGNANENSAGSENTNNSVFGETLSESSVISFNDVKAALINELLPSGDVAEEEKNREEVTGKIEGEVTNVCQRKGCWMKIKADSGDEIRVTFKDYGFFVPKDCKGKKIVLEGKCYFKETKVEELKHFAEDAGKSKEEIATITEPEKDIHFEAKGVIIIN